MSSEHETRQGATPGARQPENSQSREVDVTNPGASSTEKGQVDNETGVIALLNADYAELKSKLGQALGETEAVRRRADRDVRDMRQYAVTQFAADMLSVVDNLERAIASLPSKMHAIEEPVKALITGVELTRKEMLRTFEKHGIHRIDPIGQRFDPSYHLAMYAMPGETAPSGTVTKVLEPGYSIGARVLRPAKVGVAGGGGRRKPQ